MMGSQRSILQERSHEVDLEASIFRQRFGGVVLPTSIMQHRSPGFDLAASISRQRFASIYLYPLFQTDG